MVAAIFVVSTLLVCVHVGRQQTFYAAVTLLPDELYHVGQLVLSVIYYGLNCVMEKMQDLLCIML